MKARTAVLSILFVVLFSVSVSAQTAPWSASEPEPLSELGIPFVADRFFLANYSSNIAVVYVNGKETDVTVPAFSFRWMAFHVTAKTKVEARTNVTTDGGVRVQKMKVKRARTGNGRSYGWLFSL